MREISRFCKFSEPLLLPSLTTLSNLKAKTLKFVRSRNDWKGPIYFPTLEIETSDPHIADYIEHSLGKWQFNWVLCQQREDRDLLVKWITHENKHSGSNRVLTAVTHQSEYSPKNKPISRHDFDRFGIQGFIYSFNEIDSLFPTFNFLAPF